MGQNLEIGNEASLKQGYTSHTQNAPFSLKKNQNLRKRVDEINFFLMLLNRQPDHSAGLPDLGSNYLIILVGVEPSLSDLQNYSYLKVLKRLRSRQKAVRRPAWLVLSTSLALWDRNPCLSYINIVEGYIPLG